MSLGQRIADLRKKGKVSQSDLGKKIGTSGDIIGRYERDEVTPSIEVASKIADELGTTLDYLMGKMEFELDKSIVKRVIDIQSLPEEDKSIFSIFLDGLLQNVRTKLAFAK
ncbi:MAG: helix-turn-helix transcriptional regulator [Saprospiraceae bacterium]|nr:helix-turn-helix transcriptional regulator [Saprospiraceae bacterium]